MPARTGQDKDGWRPWTPDGEEQAERRGPAHTAGFLLIYTDGVSHHVSIQVSPVWNAKTQR